MTNVLLEQSCGCFRLAFQCCGHQVGMLCCDVSFRSGGACGPVAIELGFVEQTLTNLEQRRVRTSSRERSVETSMGVHPLWVGAVTAERHSHAEYVMCGDKVGLPVGVAVGD